MQEAKERDPGKDHDTESNLDYFYARYYSETLGRFMTPDWAAAPAAVPYAAYGDPQSLNLYAYVQNNPLTGIDATGHVAQPPTYPYPGQEEMEEIADGPSTTNPDGVIPGSQSGSGSGPGANSPPPSAPGDCKAANCAAQQQGVRVTYDKGVPAMTPETAEYVIGVLNAAGVKSATISATTNGKHAPHSWHYKGKAVDIHVVNGVRVIYYNSNSSLRAAVNAIQDAANDKSNGIAHENYGPAGLFRDGRQINNPALQRQHENHIHLTVPDPWGDQ